MHKCDLAAKPLDRPGQSIFKLPQDKMAVWRNAYNMRQHLTVKYIYLAFGQLFGQMAVGASDTQTELEYDTGQTINNSACRFDAGALCLHTANE